jgi:cysteine desulfurase
MHPRMETGRRIRGIPAGACHASAGRLDSPRALRYVLTLAGVSVKTRIYLDNSATTRVDDAIVAAMLPYFRDHYGNASSIHTFGQEARTAVEEARRSVAELLGADTREIIFTSGGTEADNAALWGVWHSGYRAGNHIITSKIEHPAVLATCRMLEAAGAEVTRLPVDSSGRVDPARVADAITDRTILISIMYANNETGVIQPIEEIGAIARSRGIVLHTDAVQAIGKIPVNVQQLGCDILAVAGHKFHAPKGVGAMWVRGGVKLTPFMTGGSHERKRRAGTENVPGLVGIGMAAQLARQRLGEFGTRVAGLRDRLERRIKELVPGVRSNGDVEHRLPILANLSFERVEGESAVIALDLAGLAVSTGSACSSGALEPSPVLLAMGLRPEIAQGSIRFSLCYHNTEAEIDAAVTIVADVVARLRGVIRKSREQRVIGP